MGFYSASVLLVVLGTVAVLIGDSEAIGSGGATVVTRDHITSIFRNREAGLDKVRNPLTVNGNQNKQATRNYLRHQLSQIATQASAVSSYSEQPYNTSIYSRPDGGERQIDGINFIVTYRGSKKDSEDEPIMIIANYDTDNNENNPIDDNGSGVASLIVLADIIAKDIANGRINLERSVIIVASDASIGKYEYGKPSTATVGAGEIARKWLPEFLSGRKSFRGAIVLDSIMNYNSSARSQNGADFSKSFPSAYQTMSSSAFTGDFLALVHRDDDLDKPLVAAFEEGWAKAMRQPKENGVADPKLIKFPFIQKIHSSPATLHFLRSDQTDFWNHHVRTETKLYPAILLTDTEIYRSSPCNYGICPLERMLTDENVDFLQRIITSIYETTLRLQTSQRNSSTVPTLSFLTVFAGILLRYLQ